MISSVISKLRKAYGPPRAPVSRQPFELILLEQSGYLCSDEQRVQALRKLKKCVGTAPKKILAAPFETLREIAAIGGPYSDVRALRMQQSAQLAVEAFGGDLKSVLKLDFKQARKALARFPMIGEPGAEKILLFAGVHPRLALESNGLRVIVRLGVAEEHKNYATMYRRAQEILNGQIGGRDSEWLIAAHQLLKLHGQETCRRSDPSCESCTLRADCAYWRKASVSA